MAPSKELAARVACGQKLLNERGIGFRPGGDALTDVELRGLAKMVDVLDEMVSGAPPGDLPTLIPAREWLRMFVDAGAAMLPENQ